MKISLNNVSIAGNLTATPELKQTQSGKSVTQIFIAVKRSGGDVTDFFTAVAWDKKAEYICKYASKGDGIIITGELNNREWTDHSGQKKKVTEILVKEVNIAFANSQKPEKEPVEPVQCNNDDENSKLPF